MDTTPTRDTRLVAMRLRIRTFWEGESARDRFAKFRGNRFDGSIVKAFPQRNA
jgi:hypothetical protein